MPHLRPFAALALVILAVVAVRLPAADAPSSDWPTQVSNAERNAVLSGSLATRRAQVGWSVSLSAAATAPAVVDGRIYLTQVDGAVVCLDANTGTQVWRRSLTKPHSMTPVTVSSDRLVFTRFNHSSDSQTMALATDSGATLWSMPVTAQWDTYGSPLVIGGRVFCGGGSYSGLYGFDLLSGAQLFFNSTLPQVSGWSPTAAQGGVLTCTAGTLRRHVATSGVVERSLVLASGGVWFNQDNLAAVSGERVVVTSPAGLHCVQPTTFAPWWTVAATGFTGTPVITTNDVFVIQSGIIQRRSITDGSLLASAPALDLAGASGSALLVCDDAVLFSKPGRTYLLDRTTLAMRQTLPVGGRVAVAESALYVMDGTTLMRLDLVDATLDPNAVITVSRNGVPVAEGGTVDGEVDVTVTISNAIGQHVQVYGNFLVLSAMDHDEMIPTSPWTLTTRVDTKRFFDGENLFSVHVHPHNHHDERHTTDFTFATFTVRMANGLPAASGDQYLPRFRPPTTPIQVVQGPTIEGETWPILRGAGDLLDDGVVYGVDQFPNQPGPIQIISHLGTSVLGRARWHRQVPPMGDLSLVDGVDVRPFQGDRPRLARIVYFFTDRAGRANYYAPTLLIPAISPADAAAVPLPVMHGHFLNLHDGAHVVADSAAGFTAWVRVVNPLPHANRYRSMTVWIGNRAVAVVPLQPHLDTMLPGATSCTFPVVIPASEISGLLAARDAGESSRAFAVWLDFNQGDQGQQIDVPNMPNAEHVHLNSVRLSSTPWPYGVATVHIESPYAGQAISTQPTALRYRTWGNLAGVAGAQVSIDGGAFVSESGFDGTMTLPLLSRGSHTVAIRLVDAGGQPVAGSATEDTVAFQIANRAPLGSGEGWRVTAETRLTVSAPGVLANDSDPDGDSLTAVIGTAAQQGVVTLAANGGFTYQPASGFRGVDRFTYRISDGSAVSGEMVVLLTVGSDGRMGVPGAWTTLGNGPGHAGRIAGSVNGRVPVQAWNLAPTGSGATLQAVIADGRLTSGVSTYFAAGMHALTVDLASGAQLWRRDFANGYSLNDPTVDGGTIYLQRGNHSTDTHLWALDAATGALRWQAPFGAQWERYLAPCVTDGRIYINGGSYGGMYGFRQSDGAQLFFSGLEQIDEWTPTVLEGRLFTHLHHRLRQHDPLTGTVTAKVQLDIGQIDFAEAYPVVAGDGALLIRSAVALTCIDATTLVRRWRVFGENRYIGLPAIADGLAYIAVSGGGIEVRSLTDGTRQGSVTTQPLVSQPLVCDDMVLVSTQSATYCLDRASLATRWSVPVGGRLSLGQHHLVVASTSDTPRLTAYRLEATNVAPVAGPDTVVTNEDTLVSIPNATLLANDSDVDGNQLTVRVVTQPGHGVLTVIGGGHDYRPEADWYGTDIFTYVANDGLADSQPVTVTITVAPVEDAPVPLKPGLLAQFFDYTTGLSVIPDLSGRQADVTRTDTQIAYASVSTAWSGLPTTMADTFASRHTGWLKIDAAGSYTLFINSDDGSRVFLDGALLINNDGLHGMQERSATMALTAGYHPLRVEFFESGGGAGLQFSWSGPGIAKQLVPASALWQEDFVSPPYVAGLLAEFFDSTAALSVIPDLTGRVPEVSRTDVQIAYASVSTAWSGLPSTMIDTFASRHSGWLKIDTAGAYTLFVSSDDGSRVYLDGAMVIDNDGLHGMQERSVTLALAAGYHPLRVEFFENGGGAGLQFSWSGPGIVKQLVPTSALWRLPAAVAGLPAPWTSTDIGAVGLAGSATGDGDDFTILGSGADIWGNVDAFQFVHRPLTTDGELIARVVSLGNTNVWAKTGVMVRASTAADSVHGMMVITPANGAAFQHRTTTGGASNSATAAGRTAPYWVRIVRSGTAVSGWTSPDGIAWTQVGVTVTLPLGATPVIGLPVTAHDNAVRSTAVFDQVVFVPAAGG